jgi:RNase P protein component
MAWHAFRVPFGCKSKQKTQASDSLNENRSVRPVAPRGQLGHDQAGIGPSNGESQIVSFLANGPLAGPTVAEMRRLIASETAIQLCLWGEIGALSVFRQRLNRILRAAPLRRALYKVDRVQQPDDQIRFDLFVSNTAATEILQKIRDGTITHTYGWYIRPHVPYVERVGPAASEAARAQRLQATSATADSVPITTTTPATTRPGPLRVVTYNINGVARKRTDLRVFLEQTRCDVLGLQETLLRATDWHLRIPNYHCFTAMGDLTASTRGVALVVSNKFACNPVGAASPYWVFARLYGASLSSPILVGTIYVPNREGRNTVLTKLPLEIARLKQEFPEDPMIVMGDWNMSLEEVQREVVRWPVPVHPLANHGLVSTRRLSDKAIDHIAYRGTTAGGAVPAPHVLDTWDLSDHYPVLGRIPNLVDRPQPPAPDPPADSLPRVRVARPEFRKNIARSTNYWTPLAEEFITATRDSQDPDSTMETLSRRWTETCHAIAKDCDLIQSTRAPVVTVSKSVSRAVKKRRRAFRQLKQALQHDSAENVDLARTAYSDAKKHSRKAIQRTNTKRWHKQIYKAHAQMLHRPREFWQFSSRHGRWQTKGAPAGLQPIYDADGSLLTNLPDIVRRWASHYEELGTDVTGHSQDEDYWAFMDPEPRSAPLHTLDEAFSRDTIWRALHRMKRHKAPGKDGIPTDFIQACIEENLPENEDGTLPPSPMTDSLVALTNWAFQHGSIPPSWEESVVLSLPKDGDLADCGNYRGISLMSTTLKVITVILADRISTAGETFNLFSPTQAGFRRKEECITQAACVIDILQRRRITGEDSYATFVDLKKAYDTVPHGALFAKLSRFGVRGRCLAFLKSLYSRSRITVRVGSGSEAQHSDSFQLLRGLRQG